MLGRMPQPADIGLVLRALAFAAHKHRDQRRKGAEASPYINHPISVANVLVNEAGVDDLVVVCAALLHDTLEDTLTSAAELEGQFGAQITRIVQEVSDDKALSKEARKRMQVEHAPHLSTRAKLVKLADKTCNLRDMAVQPPANWSLERKRAYYDWARDVVAGLRGVSPTLERAFDDAYALRPR
jgi:GTP diphosphokinase / guanosine-3',5'-bis(diphosphate) 3'-diphosphatase